MCRSAHLFILGAEADKRSDEAHDALLCDVSSPFLQKAAEAMDGIVIKQLLCL